MQALMKTQAGPGHVEICQIPDPHPQSNHVRILVHACGICGTDLHVLHDTTINSPPVILGHEFTGVIDEVGDKVIGFKPGDSVVAETTVESCGNCYYCVTGNHNICPNRRGLGRTGDGAFADYLILRQEILHHLPDEIDLTDGALLEPLACSVHAICETGIIHPGDLVLVTGPGTIGLCAAQVARAEGAKVLLAGIDRDKERLSIGSELGIDVVINQQNDALSEVVMELSGGNGVDMIVECSGSKLAIEACLPLLRRQGQYIQMGLSGKEITFPMDLVVNRELRLFGSVNSKWTSWERAIRLLAEGKVRTRPIISNVLPLTDWEQGFQDMQSGTGIKTLLKPQAQLQSSQIK